MTTRKGILAGGHFIVDHIKMVDNYPAEDQLAIVRSRTRAGGGGPYNLLCDLAAMQAEFPLQAVGLLGNDPDGQWMAADCHKHGIDTQFLQTTSEAATAWTDVMTVAASGRRTFFHFSGANAALCDRHFLFDGVEARIFYLGYLSLLDGLDAMDDQGRTGAARVFERARSAGLVTVADLVSREHPQLLEIVAAAAPQLDYLLLNELEAGWLVGRSLAGAQLNARPLHDAAAQILDLGINGAVVIHCEHGAVCSHRSKGVFEQGVVALPPGYIQSRLGAGDAFAAGFLYGVHQEQDMDKCLLLAACAAATCLADATATGGVQSLEQCLSLAQTHGMRPMP